MASGHDDDDIAGHDIDDVDGEHHIGTGSDRSPVGGLDESTATATGRPSSRTSSAFVSEHPRLLGEVRELKRSQAELRKLLDASESVGREAEIRLGETEHKLREANNEIARLTADREASSKANEREREQSQVRDSALENERSFARERMSELEGALREVTRERDEARNELEKSAQEVAKIQDELARVKDDANAERDELAQQLEALREAGRALCATYERQIAEIDAQKVEQQQRADTLERRLRDGGDGEQGQGLKGLVNGAHGDHDDEQPNSLGASHAASAADAIDAETAAAENEHLRTRVLHLEEQLEEARAHLESEEDDMSQRLKKHMDAEHTLKKEIKSLRERIGTWNTDRQWQRRPDV